MPSRAARLADRRAAELLAGAARAAHGADVRGQSAGSTLVWAAPGGFPPPACGAMTIVADAEADAAGLADDAGSFGDERYGCVIDTTRPEAVAGDEARIARLVRACRPGGTIALVAVGGPVLDRGAATRTLATAAAALAAAGAWIEGAVAFDLVGPFAPWRHTLGGDADVVLAELDAHLGTRAVRAAARLLERELVSQLPPECAARTVVVARRVAPGDTGGTRAVRDDPRSRLDAPETTRRLLALLQHDAVVRFAAFVDAEVVGRLDLPFSLVRWLADASLRPGAGDAAVPRALRANRSWYPGVDAYRLVQAASHRIATRTAALLGRVSPESAAVAPTLEYALVEVVNAMLDRRLTGPEAT